MSQLTSTNRPRSWPFHLFSFTLRGRTAVGDYRRRGARQYDSCCATKHSFLGSSPLHLRQAYACARLDVAKDRNYARLNRTKQRYVFTIHMGRISRDYEHVAFCISIQ